MDKKELNEREAELARREQELALREAEFAESRRRAEAETFIGTAVAEGRLTPAQSAGLPTSWRRFPRKACSSSRKATRRKRVLQRRS